jgi:hypothetical protein
MDNGKGHKMPVFDVSCPFHPAAGYKAVIGSFTEIKRQAEQPAVEKKLSTQFLSI